MAAGSRTRKQDEKWAFAPAIMLSCLVTKQYPQAYIPITNILTTEHCQDRHSFSQEKTLYLEDVETEMARADRRSKLPIVDFAIGLSKGKSKKIRLIEAKFKSKGLKNVESSNVPAKVHHSTEILRESGIPIESGAIVLINNGSSVQQQRRWLEQKLLARGHYQVKTVDEFYKLYFCA